MGIPLPAGVEIAGLEGDGVPRGARLACLLVNVAGLAALVAMMVAARTPFWRDEAWYLASVEPLRRGGLTVDFLRGLPGPAGPLYACVHALCAPLTGLRPAPVRLLNVGLFLLAVGALGWVARRRGVAWPWASALGILSAPVMFGVVGTAMTEVPALLFFCLHLALLVEAVRMADGSGRASPVGAALLAAAAGLCFGLAFAGRQQYLMSLVAAPVLGGGPYRQRRPALLAYLAAAAIVPAALIWAWGGVSPPATAEVGSGVSIPHGLMAFAYAGIIYCIYDVRFLRAHQGLAVAVVVAVTLANVATGVLAHLPLQELALRYVPPGLLAPLARVVCGLMMGFGVVFLLNLGRLALDPGSRSDPFLLYMVLASVLMVGVSAKVVHLFAGRYVIQALPLVLLIAQERAPDSYGKAVRMAVGCALGLLSASAYFRLTA